MAALAGQGFAQPTSPPVWLQSFEMEVSTSMLWTDARQGAKLCREAGAVGACLKCTLVQLGRCPVSVILA